MFTGTDPGTVTGQVLMPVQQTVLYGHCPYLLVRKEIGRTVCNLSVYA